MANDGALAAVGDLVSSPRVGGDALLTPRRQQRRGLASWLWRGIFGADEDFQKKLELLSKEEALVHARLKSRARWSQKTARKIIFLSVVLEVVAVSYAIATKRSEEMDWRKRTKCVLPMFVLPCLLAAIYSGLLSFTRMRDIKDQKTLERLRAERQAKIDELKEKTNYYTTQQLIQRYDLDPAAKAAAASVLASKLGADSGLKVRLGDDHVSSQSGTSNDAEMVQTSGLRNRKSFSAGHSTGNSTSELIDETLNEFVASGQDLGSPNQKVIDHFKGSVFSDGGWLARIAAMLVGEDPTQCYALICSHCHMHNGLAKKEDFTFITYYCPHCHSLNGSRRSEDREMSSGSGKETPTSSADGDNIYRGDNTGNAAASGLAAVEEVSGGFETELEKHVIGSSPLLREVRRGTNQKELGGYTR